MPYNNTPIAPSKEVTGTVSLPLARVQKIIQADPERLTVTKNASFAIALATEMMIQHLAVTTHNVVKTERKPRRNIQYRDVSGAVSKTDNLEFLVDVVPKTVLYGAYKKRRAAEEEKTAGIAMEGRERVKGKMVVGGSSGGSGEGVQMGGLEKEREKETAQLSTGGVALAPLPPPRDAGAPAQEQPRPLLEPLSRAEVVPPVPETEAMDVDDQRVPESEGEEDPAAMQIEMEMRGTVRGVNNAAAAQQEKREPVSAAPPPPPQPQPPRVSSGGFTAINGR